eukprot:2214215-Rhodomonas_salina.4
MKKPSQVSCLTLRRAHAHSRQKLRHRATHTPYGRSVPPYEHGFQRPALLTASRGWCRRHPHPRQRDRV